MRLNDNLAAGTSVSFYNISFHEAGNNDSHNTVTFSSDTYDDIRLCFQSLDVVKIKTRGL
jgi:hypothetical protein